MTLSKRWKGKPGEDGPPEWLSRWRSDPEDAERLLEEFGDLSEADQEELRDAVCWWITVIAGPNYPPGKLAAALGAKKHVPSTIRSKIKGMLEGSPDLIFSIDQFPTRESSHYWQQAQEPPRKFTPEELGEPPKSAEQKAAVERWIAHLDRQRATRASLPTRRLKLSVPVKRSRAQAIAHVMSWKSATGATKGGNDLAEKVAQIDDDLTLARRGDVEAAGRLNGTPNT